MTIDASNGEASKKHQTSKKNSVQKEPMDAVIISNSLAAEPSSKESNGSIVSVENAVVKTGKGILIFLQQRSRYVLSY